MWRTSKKKNKKGKIIPLLVEPVFWGNTYVGIYAFLKLHVILLTYLIIKQMWFKKLNITFVFYVARQCRQGLPGPDAHNGGDDTGHHPHHPRSALPPAGMLVYQKQVRVQGLCIW